LAMSSTSWRDDFRRIVKNRAIAYQQTGNSVRQLMPFEDVHGNGGLLTTVGDLLRWNQNFTTAKVGGPAFVEQQHVRGKLTGGRGRLQERRDRSDSYRRVREWASRPVPSPRHGPPSHRHL